jgi:hypothetical protein
MKKLGLLVMLVFVAISCKKNTTTTTPKTTTTVSSFSIDNKSVVVASHNSFHSDSTHFGVIAYGANANPEIQIIFYGTIAPNYGTYQITSGAVTYGKCSLTLSDTGYTSAASSGFINVTTSGTAPYNTATFSNVSVSGGAGNHMVSGTITY